MIVNADLHIHGRYSGGVSEKMSIKNLAIEGRKKGVDLIATGDCLHPLWVSEIKEMEEGEEGILEMKGMKFVLSAEVEDSMRVHHLLLFPSFSSAFDFRKAIHGVSSNLDSGGRPNLRMRGEEIAELAMDVDALIGPAHAFTPWTAIYAYHDNLKSCYGDMLPTISFIELGLSADTDYADRISELRNLTFLTNSDAHSPYPIRLAREFNRFEMRDITFKELKKAILRQGNRPILNVGLPPQEGKYNESACARCHKHYVLRDAVSSGWKCKCGGRIKKGVRDRVEELASYPAPRHPDHRPPYLHLIPLAEIIALGLGLSSPYSKEVEEEWDRLIGKFGDEVTVLIDSPLEEIGVSTKEEISEAIRLFRERRIILKPGGGGQYGKIELPEKTSSR